MTAFPELNTVLDELVSTVEGNLRESFRGVYLTGSFALGDADEHSDVAFVVVTDAEPNEQQVAALQVMHARLHGLESQWAQHLEGSYFPAPVLCRVDPSRTKLWFLDNGAKQLVLDEHCNTAVTRWTLRERGFSLAGLTRAISSSRCRRTSSARWPSSPTRSTSGAADSIPAWPRSPASPARPSCAS